MAGVCACGVGSVTSALYYSSMEGAERHWEVGHAKDEKASASRPFNQLPFCTSSVDSTNSYSRPTSTNGLIHKSRWR